MAIAGVGTDVVDVTRIRRLVEEHGERFLRRVFHPEEITYCFRMADPFPHLAARWAAKEAVVKALGTGFSLGVGWRNVWVTHLPTREPLVVLEGAAKQWAERLGIRKIWVSLAHTRDYAVAIAVMET